MLMKKCQCGVSKIADLLVFIGGLNWGLVGAGMLFGAMHDMSWNVVHMLLGSWPMVEGVVYLLVGIAAIAALVGCKCGKCKACMAGMKNGGSTMGGQNM
jgi:uncharacterized membrane protein YuzA (DUF378 family)